MNSLGLMLAEYATQNGDGTRTVVRGGISRFFGDLPVRMAAVLGVDVPAQADRTNPIKISLEVSVNSHVILDGELNAEFSDPSQGTYITIPIMAICAEYGEGKVTVKTSDGVSGFLDFTVTPIKAAQP